jgi:hypothetical protein
MVSGVPVKTLSRSPQPGSTCSTPQPGLASFERRIPDEWERDWAASTGRDPQLYPGYKAYPGSQSLKISHPSRDPQSAVETYQAIGSADHFQFIAPKEIILQAASQNGRQIGDMLELDQAVDDLGYLRLSTCARTTRHLGNTASPDMLAEAEELGLNLDGVGILSRTLLSKNMPGKPGSHRKRWFTRIPGSRRILILDLQAPVRHSLSTIEICIVSNLSYG